jgi:Zn-dependent peptidase ImmA (M78 family)
MGELVRSAEARRISLSYLVRNALQIGLLSHENYRALNKYATKESREVSDLVNEAVRQYILSRDS